MYKGEVEEAIVYGTKEDRERENIDDTEKEKVENSDIKEEGYKSGKRRVFGRLGNIRAWAEVNTQLLT